MAGMLPGVEFARRRRFHNNGGCFDSPSFASHNSTRRSSFCSQILHACNHESRLSTSSSLQRSMLYQAHPDENMVEAVREAKQRLDDKFRAKRVSPNISIRCEEGRRTSLAELQTEVYGSKKSGTRRFSWSKLSWKASEQEDCAVCLESFRIGETLIPLPCAHRFHFRCLKPWLENNPHCPCCRTTIHSL